jgi:hypothetical protein
MRAEKYGGGWGITKGYLSFIVLVSSVFSAARKKGRV